MKKNLFFRKEVLFVALTNLIANASLKIREENCTYSALKDNIMLNLAINLKACYTFISLYNEYSSKQMALKKYNSIYINTLEEAYKPDNDILEYLNPKLYEDYSTDEKLIIWSMFNLYEFLYSKNINRQKHILNTYSTKLKNVIRNAQVYIDVLHLDEQNPYFLKVLLFKFLVENS